MTIGLSSPRRRGPNPTVRELVEETIAAFEAAELSYGHGTANAVDEAAWLVLHVLGLAHDALDANLALRPSARQEATVRSLARRRIASRKPLAYLLNEAWLGPHRFFVDERVIVPRSFIAELLRKKGTFPIPLRSALDLCTGSGCLAILIALAKPKIEIDAVDLSGDALDVARRNVADYGLQDRIRLVRSDLLRKLSGRRYDLIVSNPPYVKAASMRKLPAEYLREPEMALASGTDGLEHTRRILREAPGYLNPGGVLVVEIGHNRKALEKAYPGWPFKWPKVSAGRGYVFVLRREDFPAGVRDAS